MRLKGKVAIITGGAHGMGAVEAVLFAKEGAKVVIADIREEDARKVEAEIAEVGGEAMVALLDVTKENQWERTIADVVARFGKLDILVNNAGISGSGEKDFGSSQAWDQLMDVNAKSVFLGMKHAIPEMEKAGGGAIVNISSISGMVGQSYIHPGYNASKGAVRLVTKAAAVQHAKSGIRVNSVHPGSMPPMLTSGARGDGGSQDARMAAIPMGREGQPIEVANAVLFMASDEASYITGTELMVDGGYTAK
jgi:NAD(P)-dependent dehydrogenase (short-subunit alcohol dehydrogenase family)|tara:strand:+ start:571 stop:1323 length:753 start_codon:yes stop_codon:yes gene_type:complete